jgi:hypothetical protein
LHGARIRPLLPPGRRGRPHARDRDHLRQPSRRRGAWRHRPRRAVHGMDGGRFRARPGGVVHRDPARTGHIGPDGRRRGWA